MAPPVRKIARWAYVGMAVIVTVTLSVASVRLYRGAQDSGDVVAQLRYLRGELRAGMGERMQNLFPEGFFFAHVLYGLAWVDVANGERELTAEALREARWALSRLDAPAGRAPFEASLKPAYGVFYTGWTTRLRGGVVGLAGAGAPETARFTADCAALAKEFDRTGPFPESYPGAAWPVDAVVGVAALALHDRLLPPRYPATVARWIAGARGRLDPATGLLPHQVRPQRDGPRASSQSVINRFLPEIDAGLARQQYARFRRLFVGTRLGLPVVREYPPGRGGAGDVDSGPLILGVSASATVVTIGAARVNGDSAFAGPATGLGEAAGWPVGTGQTKRYAFGLLPIGDAFLAWSAAARPAGSATAWPRVVAPWWRVPWHALVVAVLAGLWYRPVRRHLRARG